MNEFDQKLWTEKLYLTLLNFYNVSYEAFFYQTWLYYICEQSSKKG